MTVESDRMHELKTQFVSAFNAINDALNILCLHLHDDLTNYPVWVSNEDGEFTSSKDALIYALKKFTPTPGLLPQETFSCPGAVGGNAQTLELITRVNAAKDQLRMVIAACHEFLGVSAMKHIHANFGIGAIKLKEVYRHLKYINGHPRRIAWSKCVHNSHKIISSQESAVLLSKMGAGINIDIQMAKLSMLGDSTLVQYRRQKTQWVANFFIKGEQGTSLRGLIRTGLPIFYLHNGELVPPVVCFSDKRPRVSKKIKHKKLENEPFLPAINAYRKLKE
jgi:hypothetical protein